ncbi:ABC transporter permease [Ruicaihuangia caeni]|uniref:ABC transporter permease n=1 Tax=Ruicaihuangia caeni TaxID=3042517 RepID=UPI00338E7C31
MSDLRIPLGEWVETIVRGIIAAVPGIFDGIRTGFLAFYEGLDWLLTTPPFWVVIAVFVLIALAVKGWKFALGTAVGFMLIVAVDQWTTAMESLALVVVAGVIAVALAIPLGILAAKSDVASRIIRPVLDFMQTMPAFVYLIPALILFRVGVTPGIVATIIFALAPGVRLTELGIRRVDSEVVEAGQAFGSSPGRILRQIQLPLAMPTIMAGVNQVIMLALSMVVIAGMVGAGGLGGQIVASLNRIDIALGFEAGLSVVILAIFLDRLTAALGANQTVLGKLIDAAAKRRRAERAGGSAPADRVVDGEVPVDEVEVATASPRRAPTAF